MKISARLGSLPSSPIRKLVPFAIKAKSEGVKVYHLNIGDPDTKSPEVMLDVLRNWKTNPIPYELSKGSDALLNNWLGYYHRLGFPFLEKDDIQITSGGSEAIQMALFGVCDAGDEVLVLEPFYANYSNFGKINGITIQAVETKIEDGFHLPSQEIIEQKISSKTKAILFCNPNNPTGTVYTKEEIEMLVVIAKKYSLFLLSDEVYREFTYDNRKQTSLLEYMGAIPEWAIVLDSVSKRYSLCGVRIGAVVSKNKDLMAGILKMAMGRLSSGYIDQQVAAQMDKVSDEYLKEMIAEYDSRRVVLFEGLQKIKGVTVAIPEGAFYMVVKLPVEDTEAFCKWLLTDFRDNKETIMLAPAAGFYSSPNLGKDEVRMAYVINVAAIKRSVELLAKALAVYKA